MKASPLPPPNWKRALEAVCKHKLWKLLPYHPTLQHNKITELHQFSSLNRPQICSLATRIFHPLLFLPCFSCNQTISSRHCWKGSVSVLCSKGDPDGRTDLNPDNLNSKILKNIYGDLFHFANYTGFSSDIISFQKSSFMQREFWRKYLPFGFV